MRAVELAPAFHGLGYVEPLSVGVLRHLRAERGAILVHPKRRADVIALNDALLVVKWTNLGKR